MTLVDVGDRVACEIAGVPRFGVVLDRSWDEHGNVAHARIQLDDDPTELGVYVVQSRHLQLLARAGAVRKPADPFDAVLDEIRELNLRKRGDYASEADIFSNFRDAGHQLGLTPGHAVELHIATKQSRLRQLLGGDREPNNESVRDSILDRLVYAAIALALYDAGLYQSKETQ